VFGSFRAAGIHPGEWGSEADGDAPLVSFLVLEEGEALGGYEDLHRPLKTRTDGTKELVGEILVLRVGSRDEALGRVVDLEVRIEDSCGQTLEGALTELTLVPKQ
jgi:hypothetical protein